MLLFQWVPRDLRIKSSAWLTRHCLRLCYSPAFQPSLLPASLLLHRSQLFKASFRFSQLRLSLAFMVLQSSGQLHHLPATTLIKATVNFFLNCSNHFQLISLPLPLSLPPQPLPDRAVRLKMLKYKSDKNSTLLRTSQSLLVLFGFLLW